MGLSQVHDQVGHDQFSGRNGVQIKSSGQIKALLDRFGMHGLKQTKIKSSDGRDDREGLTGGVNGVEAGGDGERCRGGVF